MGLMTCLSCENAFSNAAAGSKMLLKNIRRTKSVEPENSSLNPLLRKKCPLLVEGLRQYINGKNELMNGIYLCCIYRNTNKEVQAFRKIFGELFSIEYNPSDERQIIYKIRFEFSPYKHSLPVTKETLQFIELMTVMTSKNIDKFVFIIFLLFIWGYQNGFYESFNVFSNLFINLPGYFSVKTYVETLQSMIDQQIDVTEQINATIANMNERINDFLNQNNIDTTEIQTKVHSKKLLGDITDNIDVCEQTYLFKSLDSNKILTSQTPCLALCFKNECESQHHWEWLGYEMLMRMTDISSSNMKTIEIYKQRNQNNFKINRGNFEAYERRYNVKFLSIDVEAIIIFTYLIILSGDPDRVRLLAALNAEDEDLEKSLNFFEGYLNPDKQVKTEVKKDENTEVKTDENTEVKSEVKTEVKTVKNAEQSGDKKTKEKTEEKAENIKETEETIDTSVTGISTNDLVDKVLNCVKKAKFSKIHEIRKNLAVEIYNKNTKYLKDQVYYYY